MAMLLFQCQKNSNLTISVDLDVHPAGGETSHPVTGEGVHTEYFVEQIYVKDFS